MNTLDYQLVAKELQSKIKGDLTLNDEDRERVARDTSLFYIKPEAVVYPKNSIDISKVCEYVSEKKKMGFDIALSVRSAGTCMTGGSLSYSLVLDTTKYMNHITDVTAISATAEPGVFYRDFEQKTLAEGWLMPSYPASREIAAIGGIISNNSGGEKTLTYQKTEN